MVILNITFLRGFYSIKTNNYMQDSYYRCTELADDNHKQKDKECADWIGLTQADEDTIGENSQVKFRGRMKQGREGERERAHKST